MKKLNQLKSVVTDEFSVLSKESLILILGGQAHTVAAAGSCGSSRSSSSCSSTSVCNCQCPIERPIKGTVKESFI
jgi:hypothetical protein